MQVVDFVVEALRVARPLRPQDRHGVVDVILFLCCDPGEGLAQAPWRHPADACIARDGEGFEHDFLDDQAANEVTLGDAAEECFAEALPMLGVYVIGDIDSNLAALRSERSGMPAFALRMLQCVGYLRRIVANLR